MTTPEQFEQQLRQQFQHEKARHGAPDSLKQQVLIKAHQAQASRQRQRWSMISGRWPTLWRNSQLALCCALLLVTGVLLLQQPEQAPLYYQIVVLQDDKQGQVQQHRLTIQSENAVKGTHGELNLAYQQYNALTRLGQAFHHSTGLLRQQDDGWQIRFCDDLVVSLDRDLFNQLSRDTEPQTLALAQWVDVISHSSGQLVAIAPAQTVPNCPGS